MKKLGFIGIGIMGKPMTKNLIDAGYPLLVYDINHKALEEMVDYGAKSVSSCKEVASQSEIIITMLPNSPEVEKVVLGEDGVIEGIKKGQILIDMSSIAPLISQKVAKELKRKGVEMCLMPQLAEGKKKLSLVLWLLWLEERKKFLSSAKLF
jgi:2-hydroxy-3-oxopropionate reductase